MSLTFQSGLAIGRNGLKELSGTQYWSKRQEDGKANKKASAKGLSVNTEIFFKQTYLLFPVLPSLLHKHTQFRDAKKKTILCLYATETALNDKAIGEISASVNTTVTEEKKLPSKFLEKSAKCLSQCGEATGE